ncbi:hypothetical protein PUNSTDRAFT_132431 [Punctularia strigosozonata HHB-11173 SS5]|uniref:uncharacterized protein n=1 Tax=Punctularia strigosozonata (strain HHB-11173) TaxID=741275 RepID=UPI0004417AAC|nr:uncharacterized protein PUNSTDRAFT_132431 [Punctularia strigosozonata HHB-11173 SS5]EIN10338.1 hypothetical protein PUNSTDRAFT_132431 [Punctularia strigosozonata HHB-11173 SS5]
MLSQPATGGHSAHPHALLQQVLQANSDHQYAIKVYTQRLEAEIAHVDKLLDAAEPPDLEEEATEIDSIGQVVIGGSKKPVSILSQAALLSEDSPFRKDALRRERYLANTETHPMKGKELQTLAEAVRAENQRLHAYAAQQRGENALASSSRQSPSFLEQNTEDIDWERVAENVSSKSGTIPPSSADPEGQGPTLRTAIECKIRWLGDRHPRWNHDTWSAEEVKNVRDIYNKLLQEAGAMRSEEGERGENEGKKGRKRGGKAARTARRGETNADTHATGITVDWTRRTPIDCMRHVISSRTGYRFTRAADTLLLDLVKRYGTDNWALVARCMDPPTTPAIVQARYLRTLDPRLKRGAWTREEDERLREAVAVWGKSWVDVAECINGRNNEQCRDRWSNISGSGKGRQQAQEEQEEGENVTEETSEVLDSAQGATDRPQPEDASEAETNATAKSKVHPRPRPIRGRGWTEAEDSALIDAINEQGGDTPDWCEALEKITKGKGKGEAQEPSEQITQKQHGKGKEKARLEPAAVQPVSTRRSTRLSAKSPKAAEPEGKIDSDDSPGDQVAPDVLKIPEPSIASLTPKRKPRPRKKGKVACPTAADKAACPHRPSASDDAGDIADVPRKRRAEAMGENARADKPAKMLRIVVDAPSSEQPPVVYREQSTDSAFTELGSHCSTTPVDRGHV